IVMNHPNAFTDPVLFTYVTYPARVQYLARGDAFKPGLISWLLQQIGIVPIFRIQDGGKEGLKKNEAAYRKVNNLLRKNGKIIVFAEGLCVQERRLRPLKKGVSRMVFGAYEFLNNEKLTVIPVGINYSQPDKFRSTAYFNIGEPVLVKSYIEEYKINPAKANKHLLQDLEPKMKGLITHINNKEYDGAVINFETLCKADWLKKQGFSQKNLEHDYIVSKQITEIINSAELNNKNALDEFKIKSDSYFDEVRKLKLRDWLIDSERNKYVNLPVVLLRFFLILLFLPFVLVGIIGNYPPLKATELVTKKILKNNVEFYSSLCIGFGMLFFWINYIFWFFLIYHYSLTIFPPIVVCLLFVLCGWFNLTFCFFIPKTLGMLRAVKNPALIKALSEQRMHLLSLINTLR
ncbi:MAG: hypothetical protein JWO32_401, partial [Bacteroidetes bacterium]|nr:hypothetical protein [Bacteroidota bacterium]